MPDKTNLGKWNCLPTLLHGRKTVLVEGKCYSWMIVIFRQNKWVAPDFERQKKFCPNWYEVIFSKCETTFF